MIHEEEKNKLKQFLCSKRPLILVGHGVKVSGLGEQLRKAVEQLMIPVISTSHAKGVFPESHGLYFGTFGFASNDISVHFLEEYSPDALLVLGSSLGELASLGWSEILARPELKIHIDKDKLQFNRSYNMDVNICAEIEPILALLQFIRLQNKDKNIHLENLNRKVKLQKLKEELQDQQYSFSYDPEQSPIHPGQFMRVFQETLPENAVVFSDIGNTMAWAIHDLTIQENQDFFLLLGLGSMGSGIGAAIGAKSIYKDRPVFCLVGDATMLMHGSEVFTALQNNLPIIFIVLNDGGHGMVDHGNRSVGLGAGNVRFKESVNFSKWAEAFSIASYKVHSISQFLDLPFENIYNPYKTQVIELEINQKIIPPILSRSRVLGQSDQLQ